MHFSAHMHRFPPCLFHIYFGFHAKLSGLPIFKLGNDPYVAVEYQIPQNRQETLKEKLDIYAKLSGLPIFKLGNDPYVAA